jgi:hypothetical protein
MYTLLDLRNQCKTQADLISSGFISDLDWNRFINNSMSDLYDVVVSSYEDYFVNDGYSFTITAADPSITYNTSVTPGNSAAVPPDFYKSLGVSYVVGNGTFDRLKRWSRTDEACYSPSIDFHSGRTQRFYRVQGSKVVIYPQMLATGTYTFTYIPSCPTLVNDTDVFPFEPGWAEYVIVDSVIKAYSLQQLDPSSFMARKSELKMRIIAMCANRDADAPESIAPMDVRNAWNWR